MTYYLKYRPQTLKELDQEKVRNSLIKLFGSNAIPHAFLFSGPRGTGKTSAARIVAKILNCEDLSKNGDPCNKCGECKSISRGESLDVIELDAASHRGIDDVRQIREAVKLAPVSAAKKVYIIDEAHMLTTEASNALLKTLEEPPNHVVFVLATTNPEKLIETIRSRVTNILFKKASTSEIISSLKRIVEAEKLKIDDKALLEISRNADGSFRDAAKILEQVVTEVDKPTHETVSDYLFNSKAFVVTEFLQALSARKTKDSLLMLARGTSGGLTAKEILKSVVTELRRMLLSIVGIGEDKLDLFTKAELVVLIDLFTAASAKLPFSFIEEVPLEIAVITWCDGEKASSQDRRFVEPQGLEKGLGPGGNKKDDTRPESRVQRSGNTRIPSTKNVEEKANNGHSKTGKGNGNEQAAEFLNNVDGKIWAQVLSTIGPNHASTEALLKAAHPLGLNGNTLKLGVYYKFHKEHLESNSHRKVLEETLSIVTGNSMRVICELTDPPKKSLSKSENNNGSESTDVILTEPKGDISIGALTNQNGEDIINLAEKIFSN